jgi:hypothetical protein
MTVQMDALFDMNRRMMMQRVLVLLGAAAVPLDVAFAARAKGGSFLKPAQFQLLSAVVDTIVPDTDTAGALVAGVPKWLDHMLGTWASAETKDQIIGALARIDAAAKASKSKNFATLSVADRAAFLGLHDAAALKTVPAPPNAPQGNLLAPVYWVADNGYLKLKDLVVTLYYSSETAMTQELIYEHVPGAWQPSIEATTQTRPWASIGLI